MRKKPLIGLNADYRAAKKDAPAFSFVCAGYYDSVVEAGLYVTAGTKILLPEEPRTADGKPRVVKAMELSGVPGLLFRRNSLSGAVEAITRTGAGVTLNHTLHA